MKAYLKFNKTDSVGYMCLISWLQIFKNHEIILVCDLFPASDKIPTPLKEILGHYQDSIKIINTNYMSSKMFDDLIPDPRYQKAAAANLTCFDDCQDSYFWLVDADDTMFLTRNLQEITERLKSAENIIQQEKYDSLALDFYRMQNNTWSFGICLVKQSLNFAEIRNQLSNDSFTPKDTKCLDICFDKLRRQNKLNLRSFIIKNTSFIHYVHRTRNLPYTLYEWSDTQLNGKNLPEDFLKL